MLLTEQAVGSPLRCNTIRFPVADSSNNRIGSRHSHVGKEGITSFWTGWYDITRPSMSESADEGIEGSF